MMNVSYTLKHLKYFIAVCEHKHFGRAADVCFVTQPTLSAAIKELEEILGVRLLERTKRHVLVTPIGLEMAERAREIILQANGLLELAKSQGDPLCGDLRLGVIPTIGPYLIPNLMARLRTGFPQLRLYLKEDQTERLLNQLRDAHLDILILAFPYPCTDFETYIFADDYFHLALPNSHPLAHKTSIENEDIINENLLLLEEGHCLRDHAMAACSWSVAKKHNQFAATSLGTIVQMVANGLGLTLLPEMALKSGIIKNIDLTSRPLAKDSPPRQIGLVWRKTSGRTQEFRDLGEFLKKNL